MIAFIDIETIPNHQIKDVDDGMAFKESEQGKLFMKKFLSEVKEVDIQNVHESNIIDGTLWRNKAPLYAEFNQIVAIAVGLLNGDTIRIKQMASRFEKPLLEQFIAIIEKCKGARLCAHNGKEFDFPILFRKLIIHGLPIPDQLNSIGKKPWETQLDDTMEMWSGTQWKYRVSLDLLAQTLGLPSPKLEMSGDKVAELYYSMFTGPNDELPFDKEEEVLTKIATYCGTDVFTLANVYLRIVGQSVITKFEVV